MPFRPQPATGVITNVERMQHDTLSTALPILVGQIFCVWSDVCDREVEGASPAPCVAGDRVLSRLARRNPLLRIPPIRVTPPWRTAKEPRLHRGSAHDWMSHWAVSHIFAHVHSTVATMPSGTSTWLPSQEAWGSQIGSTRHRWHAPLSGRFSEANAALATSATTITRQSNQTRLRDHHFHNPSNRRP